MSTNNKSTDKKVPMEKHLLLKDVPVGGDAKTKPRILKKGTKVEIPASAVEIWRRKHRIE